MTDNAETKSAKVTETGTKSTGTTETEAAETAETKSAGAAEAETAETAEAETTEPAEGKSAAASESAEPKKPFAGKKLLLRACAFVVLAAIVFLYVNAVFTIPNSDPNRRIFNAFYAQKENTIDVVYLGTSATNRYFIGPLAYEESGLAEFDLAAMGLPLIFVQNLIEEVEKTQDPELYIIELRGILKSSDDVTDAHIRRITDSMKASSNKYEMIKMALDYVNADDDADSDGADSGAGTDSSADADTGKDTVESSADKGDSADSTASDTDSSADNTASDTGQTLMTGGSIDDGLLDYYVPIIKYHDRITAGNLTPKDFLLWRSKNQTKGYVTGPNTLTCAPQSEPVYSDETGELNADAEETLTKLLDYCDSLDDDKQVLFVLSPYSMKSGQAEVFNAAAEMVQSRGYDVLNCNQKEITEEIGLDWEKDFYNSKHVNYLGAEKYTKYLNNYLSEHYDLPDRRGDSKYRSWEKAYECYEEFVSQGIQTWK